MRRARLRRVPPCPAAPRPAVSPPCPRRFRPAPADPQPTAPQPVAPEPLRVSTNGLGLWRRGVGSGGRGALFGPIPGEIPDSPLTRGPKGRSIPLRAKRRRDLPEGGHLENRIPSTAEVKPAGREPGRRTSEIFRTSGRAAGWRRGRPLRTETRWIGRKGEALARQGPGDASERPGAGARPRAKASTESLILAQDERWRRA